jgi:hypothetical protein
LRHPFRRRGRRQQKDRIDLRLLHDVGKSGALLRRIVDHQHAVNPGVARIAGKRLDAIGFDRIGVAHQHHRRRGVLAAEFGHQRQHPAQAHAVCQRTFRSALDRRSIRHRIGKRHAKFNDVGAARNQCPHQRQSQIGMRVAGGDEGDQGLAALGGKRGEGLRDA